ncbi:histidine--tRNA ligase [Vulgatibacter incomptus]|uniref:histidine--tRNA ligase n=1 Tax=Vulgatibacter incomptus TaxID=1391653 RepID=UPI0006802099|nr:histidine--tRNA ligase [Vulgatibacter incomptus]
MKITSVKGMNDVLPTAEGEESPFNSRIWENVEGVVRETFRRFAFDRVRTPVVEEAQLFARSVGEATDIVGKEMYTFPDRSGKKVLALQPEGTAGAARAFVEHGLGMRDPVQRWWYLGPMFRHERQQRFRYRQFYQVGAESFGVAAPEADVEILAICNTILRELGLEGIELRLNSLGDAECRPAYLELLTAYLRKHADELCGDCRDRLERNPLRVLDCKNEGCRAVTTGAPASYDHLCAPCSEHFERVQAGAKALGIAYRLDSRLVRGLDYYTRTAFEFLASALGSGQQTAVCGGGRYDALVKMLGGPDTPATGFGMGVERICALLAQAKGIPAAHPALFVALGDEAARDRAMALATEARNAGLSAEIDLRGGKLARQLSRADKRGARFAVVLGTTELETGVARLKELATGQATEVALVNLVGELAARLARR